MRPFVKFRISIKLDYKTCFNFLNLKSAGIDFGKNIISIHPQLRRIRKNKNKITKKRAIFFYINHFYNLHNNELKKALELFKKEWKKVEKCFFQEVKTIFGNFRWPKGKYICYLSIFNCNPRFLHDKTFQIFYKSEKDAKRIIAHELLHFIFYYFLEKKIKIKLSKEKKWILSEVFNTIVLNQDNFRKIISPSKELGYPAHREYIQILTNEWKKCKNISSWINKAVKIIH